MDKTLSLGGKGSKSSSESVRVGRELNLEWTHGLLYHDVITAHWLPLPWVFTVLVRKDLVVGEDTYVYGYYIMTEEANRFWVLWQLDDILYYKDVYIPAKGFVYYVDNVPINIGYPGRKKATDDPAYTYVAIYATIDNPNVTFYQAGILTGTEDTLSSEGRNF